MDNLVSNGAQSKPVMTPCVGICSTVFGDHVCRGCKRFAHEIVAWNSYSNEQKQLVENRLTLLLAQILEPHFEVVDAELLQQRLTEQSIRFNRSRQPLCWVMDLLRAGAGQIQDPAQWGFRMLNDAGTSAERLLALRQQLDQQLFSLAEAHYQRYLKPDYRPSAQNADGS